MVRASLWEDSRREIDCHKWIESQRAGCDVGEHAVRDWISYYWKGYLRARWIEHLQGKAYWIELKTQDYGLLQTAFQDKAFLLDRILDRLKAGQENLDIIQWALNWQIPMDDVIEILATLDVNSARLGYRF